jgi:hypothetical protein
MDPASQERKKANVRAMMSGNIQIERKPFMSNGILGSVGFKRFKVRLPSIFIVVFAVDFLLQYLTPVSSPRCTSGHPSPQEILEATPRASQKSWAVACIAGKACFVPSFLPVEEEGLFRGYARF